MNNSINSIRSISDEEIQLIGGAQDGPSSGQVESVGTITLVTTLGGYYMGGPWGALAGFGVGVIVEFVA